MHGQFKHSEQLPLARFLALVGAAFRGALAGGMSLLLFTGAMAVSAGRLVRARVFRTGATGFPGNTVSSTDVTSINGGGRAIV